MRDGKPSIKAHNLMLNHFRVGLDLVGLGPACAAIKAVDVSFCRIYQCVVITCLCTAILRLM
jgi:hypothetical protein